MAAPFQPRRGKAAAGRGGAALREANRPRAHGGAAGARAEAARDGTAGALGHSRRRGGGPTPAAAESSGDRVGKGEDSAEKLTGDSI